MERNVYQGLDQDLLDFAQRKIEEKKYPRSTRLEQILYKEGMINEKEYMDLTCKNLDIPQVNPVDMNLRANSAVSKLLNYNIAKKYMIVPIKMDDETVTIAMADPENLEAAERVRRLTGKKVQRAMAPYSSISRTIVDLYASEDAESSIEKLKEEIKERAPITFVENTKFDLTENSDQDDSDVRNIVNSIFKRAFSDNTSDIHIEPYETHVRVRIRVDGRLRTVETYPLALQPRVSAYIKLTSGMDVGNRFTAQDGRSEVMYYKDDQQQVADLRVSIIPATYGEDIVIRILQKTDGVITRNNLGLSPEDKPKYDKLLQNSYGIILMVGPTGSGKSTTMNTMIKLLNKEDRKIVTLENPVEYEVSGVTQIQTNDMQGLTFEKGLEAIMRHDPDIICVGEIRNSETAGIAVQAALTGHIVLSTLHTNNSLLVIDRLEQMGIEKYNLSDSILGIISQRLARKICPVCKKEYFPTDEELERKLFATPEEVKKEGYRFYHGEGCPMCANTGYSGRTGIFEILVMTQRLKQGIEDGLKTQDLMKIAREEGLVFLRENFKRAVLEGTTTLEEYNNVINRED